MKTEVLIRIGGISCFQTPDRWFSGVLMWIWKVLSMLDASETVKPPGDPTCLRMAGMFMEEAWRCTLWAAELWIKSTNHKWKIVPTHSPIKSSSAYLFHLLLDFSVSSSADVWTTKLACIGFPVMNSLESKSRPIIPYLGDEHPQLPANLGWKPTNSMGFDSHPPSFNLPGAGLDVPAQCKTLKYWLSAYLASRQHAALQTWWIPSIMDINRDVIGIWWDKCVCIYTYIYICIRNHAIWVCPKMG